MGEHGSFEFDNNEDNVNYSTSTPSDWGFGSANLASTPMGLVPMGNSINASRGELVGSSSRSSASVVESYGPQFWDHHPINPQNLGPSDINGQYNGSSLNTIRKEGFVFPRAGIDRTLEMGCNPTHGISKGDVFIPNGPGTSPHSLSQFPTNSGLIDRATRFSCFSGGNFGHIVNSLGTPQSMGLYRWSGGTIHGERDSLSGLGLESASGGQSQGTDLNVSEAVKNSTEGSSLKNEKRSESQVSLHDEVKSDGAESSGQDGSQMLEGTTGEPYIKVMNSNREERSMQGSDNFKAKVTSELPDNGAKDNSESLLKDQQPPSTNTASAKNAKQGLQASDQANEEYMHVRARRGQATNSHSLAERIRREKISERMKYLQELVPGCSKVTGKAMMLDEIINYVQSLQRQVEFLSMKLATRNPQLDFNLQGLDTRETLQQRLGPSTAMGFTLGMPMDFPPLHPSQLGLTQSNLPCPANSSDMLTRTIQVQMTPLNGGFKEPNQLSDVWEDELHNTAQIGLAATGSPSSQDADASVAASQMKGLKMVNFSVLGRSMETKALSANISGRQCHFCRCGQQLVLLTSRTRNNPGRRFWRCRNYKSPSSCGWFEWVDEPIKDRAGEVILEQAAIIASLNNTIKNLKMCLLCALLVLLIVAMWLLHIGMKPLKIQQEKLFWSRKPL